jgi:hypothetical protein
MNWQRVGNVFVSGLQRSPVHRVLSGSTMLITVTGRRSGRRYDIPVNFVRDDGDLLILSRRERTRWRTEPKLAAKPSSCSVR